MAEKKNFDSDFCGSVPLNNVNLIQSYGYLLVLDKDALNIIQLSENAEELLGKKPQDIIDTNIGDYFDAASIDQLKSIVGKKISDKVPVSLSLKNTGGKLLCLLHSKPGYLILELEKSNSESERYFTSVFQDVKYSMAAIEQAQSVKEVSEVAIHELRKLSGFDGILMYQFDKDWNGTVIAEEKDPRLEPYMGQKFPASDIPKQARQLYLKNPYRLISDRDYTPIRLYPVINPVTRAFIDLSECNLRSVPAVHLEYMKNMGIKASMSIRMIRNEQLWGLISCHNIEAKFINFEICSVFELLSAFISNKISSILNKEDYDFLSTLQQKRAALTEHIYASNDIISGMVEHDTDEFLGLFEATGAAIILNGRTETTGNVPDADALENLALWLESKAINQVFATDNLSGLYDEAAEYAGIASGMIVVPIDGAKGEYIIWFRPELVETISWGGDPNQAINFEKDGKNYHPRNSFMLWQETVSQFSSPWQKHELDVAETLRNFLYEFRTRQLYN